MSLNKLDTQHVQRRKLAAIAILDVFLLVELTVAMYFAGRNNGDFTFIFLKVFFGLLIPTLVLWRFAVRKMLPAESVQGERGPALEDGGS